MLWARMVAPAGVCMARGCAACRILRSWILFARGVKCAPEWSLWGCGHKALWDLLPDPLGQCGVGISISWLPAPLMLGQGDFSGMSLFPRAAHTVSEVFLSAATGLLGVVDMLFEVA
jgi:hypothetical protein